MLQLETSVGVVELGTYQSRFGVSDDIAPVYLTRSVGIEKKALTKRKSSSSERFLIDSALMGKDLTSTSEEDIISLKDANGLLDSSDTSLLTQLFSRGMAELSKRSGITDHSVADSSSALPLSDLVLCESSTENRTVLCESLFESDFGVQSLFFASTPQCAAFAFGRDTALVMDAGMRQCKVTPVCGGYSLWKSSAVCRYPSEPCARTLFGDNSVSGLLCAALLNADVDIQRQLASNLIICGGNSQLKGFRKRVMTDALANLSLPIHCLKDESTRPSLLPFKGTSILASLPSLKPLYLSRSVYDELGAKRCVLSSCF